jgi:hypothetical protein
MVIRRPYLVLSGGLVIVVALAIALAVALRPAPLTGDVAADAACAALASAAIKDGQLSPATFATLADAERDETIRTAKEHAKQSTIHDIRAAGQALGATNLTSDPFGRQLGFMRQAIKVRRRVPPSRMDPAGRRTDQLATPAV